MLFDIVKLIVGITAGTLASALLLRFWMQTIRVRPPLTIAQFISQLTDWLIRPLRRMIPGIAGYDWASLLGAFLVAFAAVSIDFFWMPPFSFAVALQLAAMQCLQWICYGFIGLILLGVILSWVNPYAPLAPWIWSLVDPLLRPLRRFIRPIGNIDLTPLIALVLLQIALRLIGRV